jgi:hypothetical protein
MGICYPVLLTSEQVMAYYKVLIAQFRLLSQTRMTKVLVELHRHNVSSEVHPLPSTLMLNWTKFQLLLTALNLCSM